MENNYIVPGFNPEYSSLWKELDKLNKKDTDIIFDTPAIRKEFHVKEMEIYFCISTSKFYITLGKIIIEDPNNGYGTLFMEELCKWCDEHKKCLCLTPDDSFGSDIIRLKKFYKKFGFILNKGRKKLFDIKETYYRLPKNLFFT